jgi:aspartyl-tRNA(Asn)/glutamyl-tRNA(Gln) amidotransferase subunit A
VSPWQRAEQLGAVVRRWEPRGEGRPLAVKELMAVTGVPTTANSPLDDDRPAAEDSTPVRLLRAAGWEPLATTRTHEHAWGITTRRSDGTGACNPVNPTRVPGGSSGGSAIAVAVGAVELATGTDTAGSARIPAAWCGVLGLKVTHGAVPLDGCRELAPSLDTAGLLAQDLKTLRDGLQAWGLMHPVDLPRMAGAVLPGAPDVRHDIAALLQGAHRRLGAVDEVVLPAVDEFMSVFQAVQLSEALEVHRATWPSQRDRYGPGVAARLSLAEQLTLPEDLAERRAALYDEMLRVFDNVDVLVLPIAACGPSTIDDPDHVDGRPLRDLVLPFTVPASLCGLPAISVPFGLDQDGLPVGVQLVARPGGESALLAAAAGLQAH